MNDLLRERLRQLPEKPGCYLMRDRRGRIIYVGKARSLRRRVGNYFRPAAMRRADPRLRSLLKSVQDLEWLVTRDEQQALLTENELIKQHQPRYNVLLRDDKRFLAIRGDPREPLPRLTTCRLIRPDGALYFGPLPSGTQVRLALDFLERRHGLRRCSPPRPDADTYRHCHDDVIRFCSAPCVGRVTAERYRAAFQEACACLRGERPAVLESLREEMGEAAAARDFERAAVLRDTWLALREFLRQRRRGPLPSPRLRQEAAARGLSQLQAALGLAAPPRLIECFDVSDTSGTLAVAGLVCAVQGLPDRRRYRRFRIGGVTGADDPRMLAEAVRRHYARLLAEGGTLPGLLLVDGGITQLRAAREALRELGLGELPAAGLAKRHEELVLDDGRPPLRLPPASEALMVVTRLRDEAHRFALAYHRRLRQRRIRESALDEIPGIGPRRKEQLLRAFGSVHRLARASPEAVAALPGIGRARAETILRAVGGGPASPPRADRPEPPGPEPGRARTAAPEAEGRGAAPPPDSRHGPSSFPRRPRRRIINP
jgi:excinuclease ABC subunit C